MRRHLQAATQGQQLPGVALSIGLGVLLSVWLPTFALADDDDDRKQTRSIPVEIYVDSDDAATLDAARAVRERMEQRAGIVVTDFDVRDNGNRNRFNQICRAFRVERPNLPLVYACQQIAPHDSEPKRFQAAVDAMCRMTVFVRTGCPRCAKAEEFLPTLRQKYPGLEIEIRDLVQERAAVDRLNQLTEHYRTSAASVPVFHFCNQLVIGYDSDSTTGRRLDQILQKWTIETPKDAKVSEVERPGVSPFSRVSFVRPAGATTAGIVLPFFLAAQVAASDTDSAPVRQTAGDETPAENSQTTGAPEPDASDAGSEPPPLPRLPLPGGAAGTDGDEPPLSPLPIPLSDGEGPPLDDSPPAAGTDTLLPLPIGGEPLPLPVGGSDLPIPLADDGTSDRIELPVFGELSARALGLPLFTIAVGLVDGFNPCAMWVLLFLLSVLVNLRDRWKILAVAGTFVFISGAAYFAFMAAWLNVFLLVGFLRPVQLSLGVLAVCVGGIHIKDFFAFKQGISLSIPESAKPGLYARVRRIVNAESLTGAVVGACVLAVLVNIIELLCTAGLPALYTQILTMHELPAWQNYGYLLLYNLAYMFDDSLMVAVVVITLGRRKMQEKHGRWLKLLSGTVIAVLGLVMIFRPEWLG